MGHDIDGFIAKQGTFTPLRARNDRLAVALLPQGLELALNDEHLLFAIAGKLSPHPQRQENGLDDSLYPDITAWVERASTHTLIAYIETSFFGGVGYQIAGLWRDGRLVLAPDANGVMLGGSNPPLSSDQWPINVVLRVLGVTISPNHKDEFQSLGLGKYRHNAYWFEAHTPYTYMDYMDIDVYLGDDHV